MSGSVVARVGNRISDRYRVIGPLGDGTNGEVHKVEDEHLNREVALKLLTPQSGQPATWDEARILEQLSSQYLLPVYNADVVSGTDIRYITTPVMLCDLEKAAKPFGVAPARATRWGQQMAYGLQRMHAGGLLHRDVKPSNVYLDCHDDVLLGDLGMATRLDATGRTPPDGTMATVAPEVLQSGACTIRSDIYSLAATVFYLLSGRFPNGALDLKREPRRDRIAAGQFDKLRDVAPHVSQSLGQAIERALSADPELRPLTAQDFGNQLAACHHHKRSWSRIEVHAGHECCFEGGATRTTKAVTVCVVSEGSRKKSIEVCRVAGGHLRRHESSGLTQVQALAKLRAVMRDV